jgi:RNA polymerase sigma-70 factor (ECF subfamily)
VQKQDYTEVEIVNGCLRNERKWQERLYRQYFRTMFTMCCIYANDDQEAMDLLNHGFLRVFTKLNQYEFKGSLEGWIRKVIYHQIINIISTDQKRRQTVPLETHHEYISTHTIDPTDIEYYKNLLDQIPPASARVFSLFAEQGYSHQEIADQLNSSSGTSTWHLANARTLQQLIKKTMKHIPSQQKISLGKMHYADQHYHQKKITIAGLYFWDGFTWIYWNKIYNQSQSDTQVFAMNDSQDSKKNHTLSQTEICPENTNVNNKINDYINGQRVVTSNKNTSRKNINSEISNKQYSSESSKKEIAVNSNLFIKKELESSNNISDLIATSDQNLNSKSEDNVSENRSNDIVEKLIVPACTSIKYENKPIENNFIDSVQYHYTESLVATKKKMNTSFLVRPLIGWQYLAIKKSALSRDAK